MIRSYDEHECDGCHDKASCLPGETPEAWAELYWPLLFERHIQLCGRCCAHIALVLDRLKVRPTAGHGNQAPPT